MKAGDDTVMLWHAGGSWYVGHVVGPTANVGEPRGWVIVLDGALTPGAIRATWCMHDGTGWVDAPQLKVLADKMTALSLRVWKISARTRGWR